MTVRIELALHIEGDGETEASLREHCAWLEQRGRYTAEYHEVLAHLALMMARMEWREADMFRQLAAKAEARRAKAAARKGISDG